MNYKIIITFDKLGKITNAIFRSILADEVKPVKISINYAKTDAALVGKTVPQSLVVYNEINMRILTLSDGMEYAFPISTTAVLDFTEISFNELIMNIDKYIYNKLENKLELNLDWVEPMVTL